MSARDVLHWIEGKIVYSVGFGVVLMLAIGAVLFYFSEARTPRVRVVSIAYGAGAPVRKRFLEQITLHGKEVNLDVRLIATESMDQTLSLIDRHGGCSKSLRCTWSPSSSW